MRGRVLIVAGSDSGGGAGIQADIKTVTALGGYAATALTALTAQDTRGVHEVFPVSCSFIDRQMTVVLDDIGADAIKTGMLATGEVIRTVAEALKRCAPDVPLVVDPVMVAKGGARLLQDEAVASMKALLIPRAQILTPNLPEAETLLGRRITDEAAMRDAARDLLGFGCRAVLLKGGHLEGQRIHDILCHAGGERSFVDDRIETPHTHGTGCSLASAIATGLAQGYDLEDAVARARAYVREAIATAPGLGSGHGPLNHGHTLRPFPK